MKKLILSFPKVIFLILLLPNDVYGQVNWLVGGNSFAGLGQRNVGPITCQPVGIIADSVEMASFKPGCFTGTGGIITFSNTDLLNLEGVSDVDMSDVVSFRMGGVVVTTDTGTAKYCEMKPTSLSGLKGFKFKATGNSSIPVVFAEVTSGSASNIIALKAKSTPQQGYGYGINATGGRYGVYGKGDGGPFSTSNVYGIYGYSSGIVGMGTRIGVYGKAELASTAIGVYGTSDSTLGTTYRAGFFSGILEYTGIIVSPSDEKLKENIKKYSGALAMLNALEVKTYTFRSDYSFMHLSKGQQIGIMADNLMKTFPELVTSSVHPAEYDPETGREISKEVSYKGVSYLGLVPVLVQGINEQQEQIDGLKKQAVELDHLRNENEMLKDRLQLLESRMNSFQKNETGQDDSGKPYLEQNAPNPFTDKTIIRYFIPKGAGTCMITIYNSGHALVKSIAIEAFGFGHIEVQAGSFQSGNYFYELIIDKEIVDRKQMSITR